jgi:hypothetical protein
MTLPTIASLVADNVKMPSARPLEAVIITDEGGRELVTSAAKDVLPESLKD